MTQGGGTNSLHYFKDMYNIVVTAIKNNVDFVVSSYSASQHG